MLKPLTSFRFLAAFMVYLWHIQTLTQYQTGYIGVSFFYVLSGFILTYTYKTKFLSMSSRNILQFYVARFAKIYPVHVLTFILAVPVVLYISKGIKSADVIQAILNLLLLHGFTPFPFTFNGVSWSISDEMFFYATFPFILFGILRYRKTINTSKLLVAIAIIWCVSLVIVGLYQAQVDDWVVYSFPLVRIVDFVLGILLSLIFQQEQHKYAQSLDTKKATLIEIAVIILLICAVIYSPNVTQSLRFSVYYLPFWLMFVYVFALQKGLVSCLMSNKLFIFLGEISFSFYMVHQLVLVYLNHFHLSYVKYIGLIVSLLLSSLIYLLYEEKMRKKIRTKFTIFIENRQQSNEILKDITQSKALHD